MMRFGLAVHFVPTFVMITAHLSGQTTVGFETYKRDEDDSAGELNSLEISSIGKKRFESNRCTSLFQPGQKEF